MNTTDPMMPPAIDLNAGEGTICTADNDTSTVMPESSTALPAVSIVWATATSTGVPGTALAARKRATISSA